MKEEENVGEWPITEVLDACPRCGDGAGILWHHRDEGYFVECETEGEDSRTGYYKSILDAIEAWNRKELI